MILRVAIRLGIVIAVTAALLAMRLHHDPEHARPPHAERPTAGVETGTSEGERSTFAAAYDLAATQVTDYLEGLERERQAVAAYLDALEAARLAAEAEAARVAAAQQAARPTPSSSGTIQVPSSCDGHVVPAYIIQRESGCNYGAVNPSGCGGASCVGLYQFDLRHFTSGACMGLDWHNPADQDECARRISNGGTNLAPWGG